MKTGTRVHSDVPPKRKPERGYIRMFPRNENRNEGTFAKTTLLRNRPILSPSNFYDKTLLLNDCIFPITSASKKENSDLGLARLVQLSARAFCKPTAGHHKARPGCWLKAGQALAWHTHTQLYHSKRQKTLAWPPLQNVAVTFFAWGLGANKGIAKGGVKKTRNKGGCKRL